MLLILSSCIGFKEDINEGFNKKYGEQVRQFRGDAKPGEANRNIISGSSTVPSQVEIMKAEGDYHPYVGVTKFGEQPPAIETAETYDLSQTIASAGLPADVFDLNYNLAIHPPFRRIGIEFDNIRIPRVDAYGVTTAIADKTYLTPGNKALQSSVDNMMASRKDYDAQNSQILVQEKRKISRKKQMERIFGSYEEMTVDENLAKNLQDEAAAMADEEKAQEEAKNK